MAEPPSPGIPSPAGPARPLASLRVPGRAESLRLIRATVREAAAAFGASEPWVRDLVLAVDEIGQNIVRHAYHGGSLAGDIVVEVCARSDDDGIGLEVRLTDFAPPADPAKIAPRRPPEPARTTTDGTGDGEGGAGEDLRPGGLGLHLVRALTDACGAVPPPPGAGNTYRLLKRL